MIRQPARMLEQPRKVKTIAEELAHAATCVRESLSQLLVQKRFHAHHAQMTKPHHSKRARIYFRKGMLSLYFQFWLLSC